MAHNQEQPKLGRALEDYLETILRLVREHKVARIKDIAAARDVRSASVIAAMRRLAELGLINYEKREFIDLTPTGERAARRIYARHTLLARFFNEILGVPEALSRDDACAIEHSLSDTGMDRLVRFFEFMEACPEGNSFLERFRGCSIVHPEVAACATACRASARRNAGGRRGTRTLKDLTPGEVGRVTLVGGAGTSRQRLLDLGIMPNVLLEVERIAPAGDVVWVRLQGSQIRLERGEAETVHLEDS